MPNTYKEILEHNKTIAVVGLSDKCQRTSYQVAHYMQRHGFRIIPVNPNIREALGEKAYPGLKDIPERVDIVDIFRNSPDVPPVVDEAIAIGAKVIWMQQGITHEAAALRAEAAGLAVVMDRCIMVEHARLLPG